MPKYGAVGFDIETPSAKQIFLGGHEGPFVRLCGYVIDDSDPVVTTDPQELIDVLNQSTVIYGHNIFGFDLLALAWHNGANYVRLARKAIDTLVLERTLNPPYPKAKNEDELDFKLLQSKGLTVKDLHVSYTLDSIASRRGVPGKSGALHDLVKEYGGYDKIPVDHPDYQEYLRQDLRTNRDVYRKLGEVSAKEGMVDVALREMKISAIINRTCLSGFGASRKEIQRQINMAEDQREQAYEHLESWGIPRPGSTKRWAVPCTVKIPRTTSRGRRVRQLYESLTGKTCPDTRPGVRWKTKTFSSKALTSTEGKEAFEKALLSVGVKRMDIPYTLPTKTRPEGSLSLSKDALGADRWLRGREAVPGLMALYPNNEKLKTLCEAAITITSSSTKAEEVMSWLCKDDRVRSKIGDVQASGRWAHTEPSTTNIGKRGESQLLQRAMFEASENHVLVCIDLDQVDARAVAAQCQDPEYLKLASPDEDMHYGIAARVFGKGSCDDCRACSECFDRRKKSKACTHSWNYGQGPKGLAAFTGLPLEVTQAFDEGMKASFVTLCKWRQDLRKEAARTGFVPSPWGRLLRVIPGQEYTQAPAQAGQAATRDLLCDGLLNMDEETVSCLRLVIHDEIVLEIPEHRVEDVTQKALKAMTRDFRGVSITCGASPARKNWRDCYEDD